jgi:ribosome-associated protein
MGDNDLITRRGIVVPADAMTWRFSRGTGPGGQGVNTTDSRVELVIDIPALPVSFEVGRLLHKAFGDSLRLVVSTERSQLRNREIALRRLSERLDIAATPPKPRRATRPSAASVRRRLDEKRVRSQVKSNRGQPDDAG